MDELEIKTHDFEASKNHLKKFSEETVSSLEIKKVHYDKGVGEFLGDFFLGRGIGTDHIVKGGEFNALATQVQEYLIDFNNLHESFIKEFGQVYSALESLDKDYIQAILIAIKTAQESNKKVEKNQDDLNKTVEEQKKIVNVLKVFKEKIDEFKHIADIDELWDKMGEMSIKIETLDKSVSKLIKSLDEQRTKIEKDHITLEKIAKQNFILSVDDIKKTVDELVVNMELVAKESGSLQEQINGINTQLNEIVHLSDVDEMYDKLNSTSDEVVGLTESNNILRDETTSMSTKLTNLELTFTKKLTIAYILAGSSLGLAVLELIMLLTRLF